MAEQECNDCYVGPCYSKTSDFGGSGRLNLKSVSVRDVAAEILGMEQHHYNQRGIRTELDVPPSFALRSGRSTKTQASSPESRQERHRGHARGPKARAAGPFKAETGWCWKWRTRAPESPAQEMFSNCSPRRNPTGLDWDWPLRGRSSPRTAASFLHERAKQRNTFRIAIPLKPPVAEVGV